MSAYETSLLLSSMLQLLGASITTTLGNCWLTDIHFFSETVFFIPYYSEHSSADDHVWYIICLTVDQSQRVLVIIIITNLMRFFDRRIVRQVDSPNSMACVAVDPHYIIFLCNSMVVTTADLFSARMACEGSFNEADFVFRVFHNNVKVGSSPP